MPVTNRLPDETSHILIVGGLADGIELVIGPFEDNDEAIEFAEKHRIEEWLSVPLFSVSNAEVYYRGS